jgi:hypothetical protein
MIDLIVQVGAIDLNRPLVHSASTFRDGRAFVSVCTSRFASSLWKGRGLR